MDLQQERLQYADWYNWRENNLTTLFAIPPTAVNGLSMVKPSEISTHWNYFAAVSRFFADAMLAVNPNITNDANRLLHNLADHWSVTGECCIVSQNGINRAVRPDYVWPIANKFDRELIDKYLIIYPEVAENGTPQNRAEVLEYHPSSGEGYIGVRQWRHGWVADHPIGQPISIDNFIWINTKDSFYGAIKGIVREIIVRLNLMQMALNMTAAPILQIDVDNLDSGEFRTSGLTPATTAASAKTGLGLTIQPPFDGESEAKYIERSGTGLREAMEYIRLLLSQLAVITGVPDYIFGVNLANPTHETERVLVSGQTKVGRFRREITQAFDTLNIEITFPSEPFVTSKERQTQIIELLNAGIIDLDTAKGMFG